MAPEQIERPQDVDHRADIYSLGVVFYELLTGELPLGRFLAPSEKAGTDPRLDTIVFRTLEKERDRRFQTAGDVKSEVEHVTNSEPPPMPSAPTVGRQAQPSPGQTSRKSIALVYRSSCSRCFCSFSGCCGRRWLAVANRRKYWSARPLSSLRVLPW
jgi:serine/threonine protein kinase